VEEARRRFLNDASVVKGTFHPLSTNWTRLAKPTSVDRISCRKENTQADNSSAMLNGKNFLLPISTWQDKSTCRQLIRSAVGKKNSPLGEK